MSVRTVTGTQPCPKRESLTPKPRLSGTWDWEGLNSKSRITLGEGKGLNPWDSHEALECGNSHVKL